MLIMAVLEYLRKEGPVREHSEQVNKRVRQVFMTVGKKHRAI